MSNRPTASFGRRRRARQMLKRLEELDRVDARYGLGAMPVAAVRTRRRDSRLGVLMVVCIAVVAALVLRAGLGTRPRSDSAPTVTAGGGAFAFTAKQRNGDPVGYDPCVPIRVEYNPAGEPIDTEALVRTATEHVHEASGLRFKLVGTTTSRSFLPHSQYAGRGPVVVGWSTSDEVPELAGDVAGIGGSTRLSIAGRERYISGAVVLDIDAFRRIAERPESEGAAQAIVDHEFGHVVGLGHVKSPAELMFKENVGQRTWGPGDLEGLARLGNIRCG